ncbi:hypothetical protein ABPG75_003556 [Micractinium tetrahymenae]
MRLCTGPGGCGRLPRRAPLCLLLLAIAVASTGSQSHAEAAPGCARAMGGACPGAACPRRLQPLLGSFWRRSRSLLTGYYSANTAALGGSCESSPCPAGQLSSPYGLAALPDGSSFFVADTNNNRIQHLWLNGSVRAVWGKAGSGNGQLSSPVALALAPSNTKMYVLDNGNSRVQVFNLTGGYLGQWGSDGGANGHFTAPFGLGTAPDGSVYVTDATRVQKFTAAGGFVWASDGGASGPAFFGCAADSKGVWVVDQLNGNLLQLSAATGARLSRFGEAGDGPGQLAFPSCVALAGDGTLLVTDSGNTRVQQFTTAGAVLAATDGSSGSLSYPVGIAALTVLGVPARTLLVADSSLDAKARDPSAPKPLTTAAQPAPPTATPLAAPAARPFAAATTPLPAPSFSIAAAAQPLASSAAALTAPSAITLTSASQPFTATTQPFATTPSALTAAPSTLPAAAPSTLPTRASAVPPSTPTPDGSQGSMTPLMFATLAATYAHGLYSAALCLYLVTALRS